MLQFAVVDRLLDEHGQARAQRARQSEDRHERVERAERQSWPVAFRPLPLVGFVRRPDAGELRQCRFRVMRNPRSRFVAAGMPVPPSAVWMARMG